MSVITEREKNRLQSTRENTKDPVVDISSILESSINQSFLELKNLPVSNKGLKVLRQTINSYIQALVKEVSVIAIRDDMEVIGAPHVRQAKENLDKGKKFNQNKMLATIGGLLLGAVCSNLLNNSCRGISNTLLELGDK